MNKKRIFNISSITPTRTLTRVEREEEIVELVPEYNLQDFRRFILKEMLSEMVKDDTFQFTEEKDGEVCNKVFLVNLNFHKTNFPEPINDERVTERATNRQITVFRVFVKEAKIDDSWEEK